MLPFGVLRGRGALPFNPVRTLCPPLILWAPRRDTMCAKRVPARRYGALTEDECHEVLDTSHERFRTALEHDVLLPQAMKDKGVPFVPSWDGASRLPGHRSHRRWRRRRFRRRRASCRLAARGSRRRSRERRSCARKTAAALP